MKWRKILINVVVVIILTLLTQVGGIVYLLSVLIARTLPRFKGRTLLTFIIIYSLSTFLIIPQIAPFLGREPIKHTERILPATPLTVILNRNYVHPEVNKVLQEAEQYLQGTKKKSFI